MLKILLFVSAFFSITTQALQITEQYRITGVNLSKSNAEWTGLNTFTGSVIYVRCSKGDFDDVTRDRVGGFKTPKDCEEFVNVIKKHASVENPVIATIGTDFIIRVTVSY
jgi:hypothetical protein